MYACIIILHNAIPKCLIPLPTPPDTHLGLYQRGGTPRPAIVSALQLKFQCLHVALQHFQTMLHHFRI